MNAVDTIDKSNAGCLAHAGCLAPDRCCGATSIGRVNWYLCGGCGCRRCPEGVRGVILADTEDWRAPLCAECCEDVAGNPDWDREAQA